MECMGMADIKPERVAVVCVHGVAPHPRYEFQDQVAGDLRARLNERDGSEAWVLDVVNPEHVLKPGEDDPRPTITRLRRKSDHGATPQHTAYDVTEAYWSPLDKDATNSFWVVLWILRTVFAPFNTVARVQATFWKQFFDYTFIGSALVISFGLFAVSLIALWNSFVGVLAITGLIRQASVGETLNVLNSSVAEPVFGRPVAVVLWLLAGILGAFLVGQALAAIFKTWQQRKELWQNRISIWHRVFPIAFLTLLGSALIYGMAVAHFAHGQMGWTGVGLLVLIFVAFQIGRALLVNFIVEFFGDVQIYTTRDENDARFFGLRDAIMDTAVTAIMRAVSPRLNGGQAYDRVVVIAHSLGTTIATDALTRLKQACEQGALSAEEFGRVRAFIMLGSSLEKTRYFFDVAGKAASVSSEAWHGGAYEQIFDDNPALIGGSHAEKIFWANYWYFQDPICNEVQTYADVCRNERGHRFITPWHPMLHSDYLDDPWFWLSEGDHLGALDIITGAGKNHPVSS